MLLADRAIQLRGPQADSGSNPTFAPGACGTLRPEHGTLEINRGPPDQQLISVRQDHCDDLNFLVDSLEFALGQLNIGSAASVGEIQSVVLWGNACRTSDMPKAYLCEFRDDVMAVIHRREDRLTINQIAEDFGISETWLQNWLREAEIESVHRLGVTAAELAELRELRKRDRLLK